MSDRVVLCLEISAVALDDFRPLREELAGRGICFRTLTEEQTMSPDSWLSRFAWMDNTCRTADPFAPRGEEEIARRIADLGREPAGCVVADDGQKLIGYTCFGGATGSDLKRARQGWTGVIPEYRKQGVATCLKIEGVLLAKKLGYERVVTDPRRDNVASIRMSQRVGFQICETNAGL